MKDQIIFKAMDVINSLLNEINKRQIIIHPESFEQVEEFNILVRAYNRMLKEDFNKEYQLNKMLEDLSIN